MTVARRTFTSSPTRDARSTWIAIVELLTQGREGSARAELMSVGGIAATIIADGCPKEAPIVVTCDGPRTRVYCLYDDDALDGSGANEESLGFDPLEGAWAVSLPCHVDDLDWVNIALASHSSRITARDMEAGFSIKEGASEARSGTLVFSREGFLGS